MTSLAETLIRQYLGEKVATSQDVEEFAKSYPDAKLDTNNDLRDICRYKFPTKERAAAFVKDFEASEFSNEVTQGLDDPTEVIIRDVGGI